MAPAPLNMSEQESGYLTILCSSGDCQRRIDTVVYTFIYSLLDDRSSAATATIRLRLDRHLPPIRQQLDRATTIRRLT